MFERKFLAVGSAFEGKEKFVIREKSNVGMMTKSEFAAEVVDFINKDGGVAAYTDLDSIIVYEISGTHKVNVTWVPESAKYEVVIPAPPNIMTLGKGINPDGILGLGLLGLIAYTAGKSISGANRRLPD